ncbi:3f02b4c1-b6b2-4d0d-81ef-02695027e69f [Thermothielavioides terrestris]|jgi:8-oxo-dGTP pyrophosphatase MutT (NUDIX family)|uniref:Nudix hydrolase domain-containing protein n=2 Tax=Thermothielavioides terrestris TaxID=2587410 RepID=G2RA74_THETT|nr:uncharacterized protein THITE_2171103 [Thermothielavioides terrestris NRRL 8126]AEO69662.1 hypothetical protein THITE_2171103 [Thermothielavioides terrestris NRRL 8126]SPQ26197.1 3f02b4c1-b6b2-4d0d-81ef-02695027e69f [Thermothielavioides terrestris]
MTIPRPLPEGGLAFTHQPAVAEFNVPAKTFVSARPLISGAATGALVFSRAAGEDRVLLLQRAPHDSMPLRWEIPGGACDAEDETVLHGLARELWEEAGLRLTNVVRQVGQEDVFLTRRGLAVVKVTFEVEVETPTPAPAGSSESNGDLEKQVLPEVTLDPNEHVRFVWATEEECTQGKVKAPGSASGEVMDIRFTSEAQRRVVLLGFKLRREDNERSIEG